MNDAAPPASVFISYARADRARVTPIADALIAAGHDVWWDAMIDGGAAFAKTIEAKLDSADAVIVVWSAASVGSDWVRDEAAHARDRKRLVPVSLDGTEPPLGFRQYHAIDLAAWRGTGDAPEMATLRRGIAAIGNGGVSGFVGGTSRTRASGISRRSALIAAGGAVAASAVGGLVIFHPWSPAKGDTSVAVLPFANLSGDPAQAYFSDGLSEEVRAALSRIAQLKVAAPTSSNVFRGQDDARAIARKLGVGFLLEGSVRKAGDVVRIGANLIDASTGFSAWSQTFDRKLTDIFALQSEIARTVAEALTVQVAAAQNIPGSTKNVAAYDAFLRGREFYNADSGEATDRAALAQFDAALALDPNYASAHAARSRSLADVASSYAQASQLRPMYDASIASAKRAIAIAPDLAIAHLALGSALFYGKLDVRGARVPYDRAHDLGKGDADVGIAFAHYSVRTGRASEAQSAVSHALTLDPLNARAYRAAGLIQSASGNRSGALPLFQHALGLNPKLAFVRAHMGTALFALNRITDARAAFVAEPNAMFSLTGLAIIDYKLGNASAARQSMERLVQKYGDNALYQQAQIRAQWGNTAEALAALERARVVGDGGLTDLNIDPMLDPVRKSQQFSGLLRQLGFA